MNFIRENKLISVLVLALVFFIYSKQPHTIQFGDLPNSPDSGSVIQFEISTSFYLINEIEKLSAFSLVANKILFEKPSFGKLWNEHTISKKR